MWWGISDLGLGYCWAISKFEFALSFFHISGRLNFNLAMFIKSWNIVAFEIFILGQNIVLVTRVYHSVWEGKKKRKKIKNILSFSLFRSLSRREWKDHSLVWEFKWREWNGTLIPPYSLQTPNFHSLQNWEEYKEMDLGLIIFFSPNVSKYP